MGDNPDIPDGMPDEAAVERAQQRVNLERMLQNFEANKEHFEMTTRHMANLYWMRFQALQSVGFTDTQSLDIVKARGIE